MSSNAFDFQSLAGLNNYSANEDETGVEDESSSAITTTSTKKPPSDPETTKATRHKALSFATVDVKSSEDDISESDGSSNDVEILHHQRTPVKLHPTTRAVKDEPGFLAISSTELQDLENSIQQIVEDERDTPVLLNHEKELAFITHVKRIEAGLTLMKDGMKKLRDAGHEVVRNTEWQIFMKERRDYFSAVADLLKTYIFLGNQFVDELFQITKGNKEMVTLFRKLFVLFDSDSPCSLEQKADIVRDWVYEICKKGDITITFEDAANIIPHSFQSEAREINVDAVTHLKWGEQQVVTYMNVMAIAAAVSQVLVLAKYGVNTKNVKCKYSSIVSLTDMLLVKKGEHKARLTDINRLSRASCRSLARFAFGVFFQKHTVKTEMVNKFMKNPMRFENEFVAKNATAKCVHSFLGVNWLVHWIASSYQTHRHTILDGLDKVRDEMSMPKIQRMNCSTLCEHVFDPMFINVIHAAAVPEPVGSQEKRQVRVANHYRQHLQVTYGTDLLVCHVMLFLCSNITVDDGLPWLRQEIKQGTKRKNEDSNDALAGNKHVSVTNRIEGLSVASKHPTNETQRLLLVPFGTNAETMKHTHVPANKEGKAVAETSKAAALTSTVTTPVKPSNTSQYCSPTRSAAIPLAELRTLPLQAVIRTAFGVLNDQINSLRIMTTEQETKINNQKECCIDIAKGFSPVPNSPNPDNGTARMTRHLQNSFELLKLAIDSLDGDTDMFKKAYETCCITIWKGVQECNLLLSESNL